MSIVGSISDQTLAGIITTATHGSGITYRVISSHVISLTLMLADGSRVRCSRQERSDLFMASLCSLGSTGLLLSVQLGVEPAFLLKEVWESVDFDFGVNHVDQLVAAAEHVRMLWYPQTRKIRVGCSNRTKEVFMTILMSNAD
jgi:L-gulonolactone oxidase